MSDAGAIDRANRLVGLAGDTPELLIEIDVVRSNIMSRAAAAKAAGVALRPHAKTHKLPQIAHWQRHAGAIGVQVAKVGEAEVMADAGIDDILIGVPVVGQRKVERVVALAQRATVTVCVDSIEAAAPLARAAEAAGANIALLVEVDTGLHRTGVLPGRATVELAERIAALPGVTLAGVLTHEGQVYGQARTADERRALTHQACAALVETAEAIRARGVPLPVVSVGSSATFADAIDAPGVTEVRPGTYVFNDCTQVAQGAATLDEVAAVVVACVVSRTRSNEIVVDAGSKTLTSDRLIVPDPPSGFGRVLGHDWPVLRLSEEHGVIGVPETATIGVGDRVAIVPNHICPVVNLFDDVTMVDGLDVERWPVAARGKLA